MAKRKQSANVQMKIRMKEPLRNSLEKAAKKRGVSLNAEGVERWERSFDDQNYMDEIRAELGGPASYAILMILGRAMHLAGTTAYYMTRGKDGDRGNWSRNPYAYNQAVQAVMAVLEGLRPPGEIEPPEIKFGGEIGHGPDPNEIALILGEMFAKSTLEDIADPETATTEEAKEFGRRVGAFSKNSSEEVK